uniref:Selenoprotein P n=1 Tax=Amphilophus citrinellus TaxID=61819 RepID=A0A3Q0R399_AMPCI
MWAGLSLLLTLCLLHGGGAESEGGGPRCQLPPAWRIGDAEPMKGSIGRVTVVASRYVPNGLQLQLDSQGFKNVVYMVVNHQGEQSQRLHPLLEAKFSKNITLYKQVEQQPDVWQTLGGEKDDFFIYDRCGHLTHRISLPYSIIGQGHIERAIKDTYCKRLCGECTHEVQKECNEKVDAQPNVPTDQDDTRHSHSHGHHHGHGHGHGHHGDNHGVHSRGFGHGHGHNRNHGHHHGNHADQSQRQHAVRHHEGDMPQTQHHFDLGQIPQEVHFQHIPQEAHVAPDRP